MASFLFYFFSLGGNVIALIFLLGKALEKFRREFLRVQAVTSVVPADHLLSADEEFRTLGLEDDNKDNGGEDEYFTDWSFEGDLPARKGTQAQSSALRDSAQVIKEKKEQRSEKMGQQNCECHLRSGEYVFGEARRYNHSRENPMVAPPPPQDFNFLDLPIRPGESECPYYMHTGYCKYGSNCWLHHPDPTVVGEDDIPPCSKSLNSSGESQEAPTSISSPQIEMPPYLDAANHFAPMMLPPQGVHPNIEWNGYKDERDYSYHLHTGSCKCGSNCRLHYADPTAFGHGDIPSYSVSLHPAGAWKPASTSWSLPLNETVPYLDAANSYASMMPPPEWMYQKSSEWNEYQGDREYPYYMHNGSYNYVPNCRLHCPDSTAEGCDIPSGSVSLHPSGALQLASTFWLSSLNENNSFLDAANTSVPVMLPPRGIYPNTEWNGYQASIMPNRTQPLPAANPNTLGWSNSNNHLAMNDTSQKGEEKTKIVTSVWCEICNVNCGSKEVLDQHKLGKRHNKKLEKLEESKKEAITQVAKAALAAEDSITGQKESPAADTSKTIMQSAWFEICKIDCSKKDVLDHHKLGKKHKKKLEKLLESKTEVSAAAATVAPGAKDPVIGPKESPAADEGKIVVQSAWCEICNFDCKSNDLLDRHKLQKKHKKNLEKLEKSRKEASAPAATVTPAAKDPMLFSQESPAAAGGSAATVALVVKDPVFGPKESPASGKNKIALQSAWSDICMIDCQSNFILDKPELQKHTENMEKLKESNKEGSASAATETPETKLNVIDPMEIPAVNEGKTVVQSGWWAPAAMHHGIDPRESRPVNVDKTILQTAWCEICNIDCGSNDVLDKHKLQKKHKNKLEESTNALAATVGQVAKDPAISTKESPAADEVRTIVQCTLCEVCNKDALEQDKLGEKHKEPEKPEGSKKEANAPAATGSPTTQNIIDPKESLAIDEGKTGVQYTCCEICMIDCYSKDVLDQHKLGKKHKKNLEKLKELKKDASAPAAKHHVIGPKESLQVNECKTIVQSSWCDTCKVDCGRKVVLDKHKLGKKHNNKLKKLEKPEEEASVPGATLVPAVKDLVIGPEESPAVDNCKTVVQCAWCKICKIDCKSNVDLEQHVLGKKHKRNLEILEEPEKEASAPAENDAVGPKESPVANNSKTVGVQQGDMIEPNDCPAADDDRIVCMLLCKTIDSKGRPEAKNEVVLDQHKLGKKHDNNLEKFEESVEEVSAPGATLAPLAKDLVIGPKESPAVDNCKTVVQSVWCEICKIDCKSKAILKQHISGKKHKRNFQKVDELEKEASSPTEKDPGIGPKESLAENSSRTVGVQQGEMIDPSSCQAANDGKAVGMLEDKMIVLKESPAANNNDVLAQHKLKKKHKNNLEILEESQEEASVPGATSALVAKDPLIDTKESPAVDNCNTVVQSTWCEICKTDCKSKVVLEQHMLGKKHKRNLENLEESEKEASAPEANNPMIGRKESPAVNNNNIFGVQQGEMIDSHGSSVANDDETVDVQDKMIDPKESTAANNEVELDQCKLRNKNRNQLEKLEESKEEASAPGATSAAAAKDLVIGLKGNPVVDNGNTVVQSAWCEICRIDCKIKVVLDQHILGKKHKRKLEKSEKAEKEISAPAANDPMIHPEERAAANNSKTVGMQQGEMIYLNDCLAANDDENVSMLQHKMIDPIESLAANSCEQEKKKEASSLGPVEDHVTPSRKMMECRVEADLVNI